MIGAIGRAIQTTTLEHLSPSRSRAIIRIRPRPEFVIAFIEP